MTTEFREWFAGKDFTTDWTSTRYQIWISIFAKRHEQMTDILEVGSWEGRSAIFFLRYFDQCTLTCIDTFSGSPRNKMDAKWTALAAQSEARFDANLAEFKPRCRKLKGTSFEWLGRLAIEQSKFDMIYIDGSHHSIDVYADAAMSWPMLSRKGVMIFDDYEWSEMPDPEDRPKPGIDAFLSANAGGFSELFRGSQIIIEKA
jgi:predicted O-methyltransferase YrrM